MISMTELAGAQAPPFPGLRRGNHAQKEDTMSKGKLRSGIELLYGIIVIMIVGAIFGYVTPRLLEPYLSFLY